MSKIRVNQDKVTKEIAEQLMALCPFNAFEYENGTLSINASCRVCKLCVRKGPEGVCEYVEAQTTGVNKSEWQGIGVYVEYDDEGIHPVTFELIGKARELAQKTQQPVYAILIGDGMQQEAETLLYYGVDKVYRYAHPALKYFNIERYTEAFGHWIESVRPSTILIGATPLGRAFAPRIAARFKTGLTADCTYLDIKDNTDLVQVRPAFGGNIMASIVTANHRPQLATVRPKIFPEPTKSEPKGEIIDRDCSGLSFSSRIRLIERIKKEKGVDIVHADVIVACGRGVRTKKDLELVYEFAELLGAEVACTRPLIEKGWFDPKRQIGLSGRTVAPKLLINLGISGAVQYTAGITGSDYIISINTDPQAPIMQESHLAIIGDLYEVIPRLMDKIKEAGGHRGI